MNVPPPLARSAKPGVLRSIADPVSVAQIVQDNYAVGPVTDCVLSYTGWSDHYVFSAGERRLRVRVIRHDRYWARPDSHVLEHRLARRLGRSSAVTAGHPLATATGSLCLAIEMPEGDRCLSVSEECEVISEVGRPRDFGRALAVLHAELAGTGYRPERTLDVDDLVLQPLRTIEAANREVSPVVCQLVNRLAAAYRHFASLDRPQFIHGDSHPGNVLRTPTGLRFIDLEHHALGPRLLDLVALSSLGQREVVMGYVEQAGVCSPCDSELMFWALIREIWNLADTVRLSLPAGKAWTERAVHRDRVEGWLDTLRQVTTWPSQSLEQR